MQPVNIVTIKEKLPLYTKEGELANKIELVTFEEFEFQVVSQKDLYKVGDSGIYILPDYCVPDTPLFENFIRPFGDESKSFLGKINGKPTRIRAKKFNMSLSETEFTPVYSNGILLPVDEVLEYLINQPEYDGYNIECLPIDSAKALGVTKYEEPEETIIGSSNSNFPEGVYKTDETNINGVWKKLYKKWEANQRVILVGTEKVDGSSITIGVTNKYPQGFICSRKLMKPLTIRKVSGRRKKTFLEYLMFWKKPDLNLYTDVDNPDTFVRLAKPILNKLLKGGEKNIILRGELNGGGAKGSGNKNNPAAKEPLNIKIFGVDYFDLELNEAIRCSHTKVLTICHKYDLTPAQEYFTKEFNSREEVKEVCEEIFKQEKSKGRLIEGIVLRDPDGKYFSAKYMNDEYDSKK